MKEIFELIGFAFCFGVVLCVGAIFLGVTMNWFEDRKKAKREAEMKEELNLLDNLLEKAWKEAHSDFD